MDQVHIIDKAIERLNELSGIEIQFKPQNNHKNMVAGIINIGKKPGVDLDAEVKNEIREAQLPVLIKQMRQDCGLYLQRYKILTS